ncbi:hypothetical protein FRC03_005711 [Tulasnella sp. 419]|nr:hypothetical protein FRC03_005711 [Tulasnella sp. 419]
MADTKKALLILNNNPLTFQLRLITSPELRVDLQHEIEELGGRVVAEEKASLYLVDDIADSDVSRAVEKLPIQAIVLKWDWIIECYDQGRFIDENENWGGFRLQHTPRLDSSSSASRTNEDSNRHVGSAERMESFQTNHYSTQSGVSDGSVRSITTRTAACSSASTDDTSVSQASESSPQSSHLIPKKRPRQKGIRSQPKRKRTESPAEGDKSANDQSDSRASSSTVTRGNTPPPRPPSKVVTSEWFGNDYTKEDHQYIRNYIGWACARRRDPNFWELFKEMAIQAPHHSAQGWRSFFQKHELDIVRDVPELRRLYEESSGDETDESEKTSRPKKLNLNRKRPTKLTIVTTGHTPADVTDDEKRALIRFMAEAPEGVDEAELLQNFAHYHPSRSWRTWQNLIRKNKESFERAVEKRRQNM